MKIKKVFLKNIRSYEEETIVFNEGSTLLSGDIGSGKTSVLLAIEFALFGLQPGQKGSSLLRNGKEEGEVSIEFEIQGKEIQIHRILKRGKSISQSYCSISIQGEKKELSVTEVKNRVLELLNYPDEFAKKQNLLYKFTVYTPQEEMKQIILQDPESRINTIRHVFGIDKYKRILENITILLTKLREEKRINQALTANIEADKEELEKKIQEAENKKKETAVLQEELIIKKETRKKIESEKKEIKEKIDERNRLMQEIEKSKISQIHKKNLISDNQKKIILIEKQIEEMKLIQFDRFKIINLENETNELKKQREEISEKKIEIMTNLNTLNLRIMEDNKVREKLTHIEVCPTCLQDVNSSYKENVVKRINSNIVLNESKIQEHKKQFGIISDKINETDKKIHSNEKEINKLKIIEIELRGIQEKQSQIQSILKENSYIEKDIEIINQQIEALKSAVNKLQKYENLYEINKKEFEYAINQEKIAEIKFAELNKEIEFLNKNIDFIREKIKKTKQIEEKLNYITELENWFTKKFIPLISFIEKNVMIKLKSEFTSLFQKWFSMLVSESFNARLQDDFTPIIEQQDYEIDYAYLSGGERTAVALAYRLALNQVINSLLSKIKTRDLVILDEPTDGFSDAQLEKMREVFQELNVEQLIIVSHEPKIESFVENVIKFKRDKNVTVVER